MHHSSESIHQSRRTAAADTFAFLHVCDFLLRLDYRLRSRSCWCFFSFLCNVENVALMNVDENSECDGFTLKSEREWKSPARLLRSSVSLHQAKPAQNIWLPASFSVLYAPRSVSKHEIKQNCRFWNTCHAFHYHPTVLFSVLEKDWCSST